MTKPFDSILNGYPVSSLLFWKRSLAADNALRLGRGELRITADSDGWFIVDGQQRVTALAASLLDVAASEDRRWDVRFDVSTHRFLSGPPANVDLGRHVPLRVLGDLRRLDRWLTTCALDDDEKTRGEELRNVSTRSRQWS